MDKEVIKALRVVLEEGLEATLITVVKVLGSVPRKPGAQMLVLRMGRQRGRSVEDAGKRMLSGKPFRL